jgi:hypothetical protein
MESLGENGEPGIEPDNEKSARRCERLSIMCIGVYNSEDGLPTGLKVMSLYHLFTTWFGKYLATKLAKLSNYNITDSLGSN